MTIVLSAITDNYIVQVADRRLTYPDGRIADSDSNKLTVLFEAVSMGYTGLAQVQSAPTDEWALQQFASTRSIGAAIETLADAASRTFTTLTFRSASEKRHLRCTTFAFAGFARFGSPPPSGGTPPPLRPFYALVSNHHDPPNNWLKESRPKFEVELATLDGSHILASAGQPLPGDIAYPLQRHVRSAVQRGSSAFSVARLLYQAGRQLSAANLTVGADLQVIIIERESILAEGHPGTERTVPLLWHPITPETRTELARFSRPPGQAGDDLKYHFMYVPADPGDTRGFAPNVYDAGVMIMRARIEPTEETTEPSTSTPA